MNPQQPPPNTQINPQTPPPGTPQGEPAKGKHLIEEADIGSGEKTPAEHDTEELIRQIPPLPGSDQSPPVEPPSPTHDR
jgi:hypothetical protein